MKGDKKDKVDAPPTDPRRQGWDEAFKRMAAKGTDHPLDETIPTLCDEQDWEW